MVRQHKKNDWQHYAGNKQLLNVDELSQRPQSFAFVTYFVEAYSKTLNLIQNHWKVCDGYILHRRQNSELGTLKFADAKTPLIINAVENS